MPVEPRLTRRSALALAAAAGLAGVLRDSAPALAREAGAAGSASTLQARSVRLALTFPARAASAGGWATSRVLRPSRPVALAGLVWGEDGPPAHAELRGRRRGGDWTPWTHVHAAGDHGPDGGGEARASDPVWLGRSDELQVRVRGGSAAGARVHAIAVRGRPARTARAAQVGGAPVIIPRAAWGGDTVPPRSAPEIGDVQMAFVHHTVTANAYAPTESASIVLGIARYHRDANGWNDIGYNFLVDRYGQVFEGRAGGVDQAIVGAQAQGWNSHSTGVAVLGTYSTDIVTAETVAAVGRLIGWKLAIHGITPTGQVTLASAGGASNRYPSGTPITFERISGHRDGDLTSCPGDVLYNQLPAIRAQAVATAPPPSAVPAAPPPVVTVTAKAATRRVRAGSSVLLTGVAVNTRSVQVVVSRAGGDGTKFSYVHRVRVGARGGRYRGRIALRSPGLYRLTVRNGSDRAPSVYVRAVRRTHANGGLSPR